MSSIYFEHPWVFGLLVLFILCHYFCKARSEAIIFPHLDIFYQNIGKNSWLLHFLKWLTVVFILTALASPVQTDHMVIDKKEGYSIVLSLDASGSMKQGFDDKFSLADKNSSKFKISIQMAKDFIQKRTNDQIALVVFGNFAYVASPLTYDKTVIQQILDKLYATIAGANYTVINDSLFQSAKLFEKSKAKSKIVILLTDGQSRGDHIPFAVSMRLIKQYGVKIYTIGIGEKGDFNEAYLQLIAQKSGGKFFSANNPNALQEIYAKINMLEKSQIENNKYIKKQYLFELPLFVAFMALLFYTYLLNKRGIG